jgi:hypothetical protein
MHKTAPLEVTTRDARVIIEHADLAPSWKFFRGVKANGAEVSSFADKLGIREVAPTTKQA